MKLRHSAAVLVALAALAWVGTASASKGSVVGSASGTGCIAHHPNYIEGVFEPRYSAGCSGHDEPELDPISGAAGSAKNFTWRFVLPSDGSTFPVSATGPTFWFGGTVTDPNSLFGQSFLEVQ